MMLNEDLMYTTSHRKETVFLKNTHAHESDPACRSQELKGMEEHIK